ncbi:MAG: metallophosphoesterase family protein [Planctomycetes bacterium]|nr:metallophosphoesterase family protein [Planctomycetota bacterium]
MKSLIFADIHANLPALEAVLDAERGWDEVLFLGDAVIGGPQPQEVVRRLSALPGVLIAGNHDLELLRTSPDGPPAADPHRAWIQWTRRTVSPETLTFLDGLPRECTVRRQGLTLHLFHGRLDAPGDSRVWPDSPAGVFSGLARRFGRGAVLLGHSHVQFRRDDGGDGVIFVNPGGAGQPRLGRPLAAYAVLEDGRLSLRAAPYDTEAVCRAMDGLPLPADFIADWQRCYRTGVLPQRYRLRDFTPLRGRYV